MGPKSLEELTFRARKGSTFARQRNGVTISVRSQQGTADSWDAHVIGASPAIREVIALATQVAASRSVTVLLVGETGTGKELFARGIHAASARAAEPFVAINCAAIPETLLESELFGHEPGAFTDARALKRGLFEVAGSGTVFLDEVAELPLKLQAKLLRVVEDRRFRRLGGSEERALDARIVAGTNSSLETAVADNRFRADLFYRLNVARLELPALRERDGDISILANYFVKRHAESEGRENLHLGQDSISALERHRWPGNIRELKNVIERAVVVCAGDVIQPHHLSLQRRSYIPLVETPTGGVIRIPAEGKSLQAIVDEAIHTTIGLTGGNLSAAARILGISRPTLTRKLRDEGSVRRNILASS
ncbi:MAG TPA: sigma 54-interacting transcriptional regulator [Gemmatimonadaceae bacterium]|nr:sigma 54-interacting transcriptional regulator [Gemmatimonadaceae bacterium]